MYIATVPNRTSPPAILLRESYREDGKVKNRTIANLSRWKPERIEALRKALKGEFDGIEGEASSGLIFGVLFALKVLADRLGLTSALGHHPQARLALFLVLARVAHQGSRLSALRWSRDHAVDEILNLDALSEDALLEALDWLDEHQQAIEGKLYESYVKQAGAPPVLVLYDVTSSYFEGEHNELAAYGYNRDGKRGKKQIVVGLMTDDHGHPLAIRVFRGNASDPTTVPEQIETLKRRFGIDEVVFVGDRGMVKAKGKWALMETGYHYISALTDAQVRKLLTDKVFQFGLFDEQVHEVEHDGFRLVLRRNDTVRRKEQHRRDSKLKALLAKVDERNAFVAESPRAIPEAGLKDLQEWAWHHKLSSFVTLDLDERMIRCDLDEAAKDEAGLLDGCYVIETDVPAELLEPETVNDLYTSLQRVERDFRTLKTSGLEMRPICVRKASRTRGHVFATMLALIVTREIQSRLTQAFGTTDDDPEAVTWKDAMASLSRLTFLVYNPTGKPFQRLMRPDAQQLAILDALDVPWPAKAPKKKSA